MAQHVGAGLVPALKMVMLTINGDVSDIEPELE